MFWQAVPLHVEGCARDEKQEWLLGMIHEERAVAKAVPVSLAGMKPFLLYGGGGFTPHFTLCYSVSHEKPYFALSSRDVPGHKAQNWAGQKLGSSKYMFETTGLLFEGKTTKYTRSSWVLQSSFWSLEF